MKTQLSNFDKEALQAELILHHISMKTLASLLNTSETTISRKMNGICQWKQEDLVHIADIIGREKMISIFFTKETA